MVIVAEEGIVPCSIGKHIVRVEDPQTPCHVTVGWLAAARCGEVGIADGCVYGERTLGVGVGLVVPICIGQDTALIRKGRRLGLTVSRFGAG